MPACPLETCMFNFKRRMIMKKYFDTPSITLVRMHADVIATSVGVNPEKGNGNPQAPGLGYGAPGRRSIWD